MNRIWQKIFRDIKQKYSRSYYLKILVGTICRMLHCVLGVVWNCVAAVRRNGTAARAAGRTPGR